MRRLSFNLDIVNGRRSVVANQAVLRSESLADLRDGGQAFRLAHLMINFPSISTVITT